MFNALEENIAWPSKLPSPANLEVRAGAHGQIFQMAAPNSMVPLTAFNYHVRGVNTGEIVIPEFVVQAYGQPVPVPAARLEISSDTAASPPPALSLSLEISKPNAFVGEPIPVRILMPAGAGGVIQGLAQVQFSGEGFLVDLAMAHQRLEAHHRGGSNVTTFIHETTLTPITTGTLSVMAQGFTAGNRFPVMIQGASPVFRAFPQYTLLDSEPAQIQVRPLPKEGELPGFTGAIGAFGLDPPALSTNVVRVGDPVKLAVSVHGNNLARLIAPPPPAEVSDWQVFSATSDGAPPQLIQARGFAVFIYTFIPLTEKTSATPAIPFSYFDPEKSRYQDLTIQPVPVQVVPGVTPADVQPLLQTQLTESEKEPVLSGLAPSPGRTAGSLAPLQQKGWFLFLQLAPALIFLGLWNWDRRRRYLEHHPDILLRRRARRALRRERRAMRQAARAGDAERFASAAVAAMRVACAPHYPAEPRALVGSDVLDVLREPSLYEPARAQVPPAVLPLPFLAAPKSDEGGWGEGSVLSPTFNGPQYAPSFHTQETHPAGWDKTRELVRRFFAMTDATRFDTDTPDPRELLSLQPEIEAVLEELEARL
jgi:hypothetical protein